MEDQGAHAIKKRIIQLAKQLEHGCMRPVCMHNLCKKNPGSELVNL
jgi:Amino-terminal Zinc-binding domain of ubiquitin ligase E3A